MQDANLYNMLPEPTDDENDMLDLAYGLTETCALPDTPQMLFRSLLFGSLHSTVS